MQKIYILDRYTNKNITIEEVPESDIKKMKPGDKIVFEMDDKGRKKLSIGTYTGHMIETDRTGYYIRPLEGEEKKYFNEQQKEADKHFPTFKKDFKKSFKGSIPVTARYQIFSRQIYFYFYAEQRYQFGDFVRNFQQKVGTGIFFFQIGARDMIKLSPATDNIVGCNGMHLCCKSSRPLPSVDIEDVLIQHLEGRDIERLKGRCGKLKCSIIYEVDTYLKESKKYPKKGEKVEIPSCDTCGICTNFNINTGEVMIKTEDGMIIRVNLEEVKQTIKKREAKNKGQQNRKRNKQLDNGK